VATEDDLTTLGFRACCVMPKTLNIDHGDSILGPFCRLAVQDTAPQKPGVYAWAEDKEVMYVGKADVLRQIVQGARMQRAYNDYTYIPASKVRQASSPRVRVNGLLNRAFGAGSVVRWWWIEVPSPAEASRLEAKLIADWSPPWNRARPTGLA
jgi:hypothetical protein